MKKLFVFAFVAVGFAAQAQASSVVDNRGYTVCEDVLAEELRGTGPTFSRTYFVEREEAERTYYINAHVWANSERSPVRATCVTSANGREVLRLETERDGAYTLNDGTLAVR